MLVSSYHERSILYEIIIRLCMQNNRKIMLVHEHDATYTEQVSKVSRHYTYIFVSRETTMVIDESPITNGYLHIFLRTYVSI